MRKCEKIIFNTIDKKNKHAACQAFLAEERALKQKGNKNAQNR
jgi:hypothetical protein